jgi:hypothetical protein
MQQKKIDKRRRREVVTARHATSRRQRLKTICIVPPPMPQPSPAVKISMPNSGSGNKCFAKVKAIFA